MKTASEARVQSLIRMEAAQKGRRLMRNNVGVLKDAAGRPVRYGLANDSKRVNELVKSADLIGWETMTITPDMVGQRIARFLSVECKAEGWKPNPNDPREKAQRAWADLVNSEGGRALIVSGPGAL